MDQRKRSLVLVGARAGAGVVRRVEHAVGDDQVRRAAGLEAAEARRAALGQQIVKACRARAEGEQVLAGNDVVAAVSARDPPRLQLPGERVGDQMRLDIEQVERAAGGLIRVGARENQLVVQDARPGVFALQVLPAHRAICAAIRRHPLAHLVLEAVAGLRAGEQQHVVLPRITQPGAEDVRGRGPDRLAGAHVQRGDGVILRHGHAPALQLVLGALGQLIERVEAAVAGDNAVVQEAVPRRHAPQQLARVTVERRQARTRREVLNRVRLGEPAAELLRVVREAIAAEQHVLVKTDEGPFTRHLASWRHRQRDGLAQLACARIKHLAGAAHGHIHGILGGDVVRAAAVRTGNVLLVVGRAQRRVRVALVEVDAERAEVGELGFPEQPAGVNIAGAEAVHALQNHPPADDLLGRAMTVTRENVEVRVAAKPQQAERSAHAGVVGLHGVADVAVLVRPVSGVGQWPGAGE